MKWTATLLLLTLTICTNLILQRHSTRIPSGSFNTSCGFLPMHAKPTGRANIALSEFQPPAGIENEIKQMIISPPKTLTQTLIV